MALLPLLAALAVIVVVDLTRRRIPDVITVPGTACLILAAVLPGDPSLPQAGLGITLGGGAVLLIAIVSRGAIGGGDVKLVAMLGGALGWKGALLAFALSQALGGAVAMGLLLAGRGPRDHLPVGSLIALLGALLLIGQG